MTPRANAIIAELDRRYDRVTAQTHPLRGPGMLAEQFCSGGNDEEDAAIDSVTDTGIRWIIRLITPKDKL